MGAIVGFEVGTPEGRIEGAIEGDELGLLVGAVGAALGFIVGLYVFGISLKITITKRVRIIISSFVHFVFNDCNDDTNVINTYLEIGVR